VAEVLRSKKGITAVGNAQVDTAQSKFGGASALFDGTGDYLEITKTSDLQLTHTQSWTIEFFVRIPDISGDKVPISSFRTDSVFNGWSIEINNATVKFWQGTGFQNFNSSVSANTWHHIAITSSSGSFKMFLDGTEQTATGSLPSSFNNTTTPLFIGRISGGSRQMNGHIDEVRISDSARYTTTFTPSTTPFVNDANTLLLIHADGTDGSTFFDDDNGVRASRSLIAIGNAQVDTAQSKFGGSALLCDGTGDYLLSPAGTQWDFGTGDFTIEFFIRFNAINTLYVPIALRTSGSILNGEWWCEVQAGDNKMYWGFKNQAGTTFYANFPVVGTAMTTGSFHHIALVKNGSTLTQYLNGTANGNVGTGLSGSFGISTSDLWIGAGAGAYSLNGWMDEVRISNSARYTTTFTPSTTPFVNDANTLLLIHANGTDASTVFRDDNGAREQKGIQAIGNAQVDTAQSKFGGASALFDGTGDYLIVGNTVDNDLALTGTTWTVEYWARINAHAGSFQATVAIWDSAGSTGSVWYVSTNIFNTTNKMGIEYIHGTNSGSGAISFGSALSTGVWQHHAFVRNGNTLTAYLDGVSQGTHDMTGRTIDITGFNSSSNTSLKMTIGAMTNGNGAYNGHLDEVRVSNSARYTAGFTPSTTPFQNDANTVLLMHMDGTDASTVFTDDNGIAPYTP
jgi:hypothetical protein